MIYSNDEIIGTQGEVSKDLTEHICDLEEERDRLRAALSYYAQDKFGGENETARAALRSPEEPEETRT